VEKAQAQFRWGQAVALEQKIRKSQFTLEDFLEQLQEVKKMGPLQQVLGMLPGANRLPANAEVDESALVRIEADDPVDDIGTSAGGRRSSTAHGGGASRWEAVCTVQDVNKLFEAV